MIMATIDEMQKELDSLCKKRDEARQTVKGLQSQIDAIAPSINDMTNKIDDLDDRLNIARHAERGIRMPPERFFRHGDLLNPIGLFASARQVGDRISRKDFDAIIARNYGKDDLPDHLKPFIDDVWNSFPKYWGPEEKGGMGHLISWSPEEIVLKSWKSLFEGLFEKDPNIKANS